MNSRFAPAAGAPPAGAPAAAARHSRSAAARTEGAWAGMSSTLMWRALLDGEGVRAVPRGTRQLFGLVQDDNFTIYEVYRRLAHTLREQYPKGGQAAEIFFALAWERKQVSLLKRLRRLATLPEEREALAEGRFVSTLHQRGG